jgi:hypothetical protein
VQGLREMVRALEGGESVTLTADIPERARVAGLGIVTLARSVRPADLSLRRRHQPALSVQRTGTGRPSGCPSGAAWWPWASRFASPPTRRCASAMDVARRTLQDRLDAVHARAFRPGRGDGPGAGLRDGTG